MTGMSCAVCPGRSLSTILGQSQLHVIVTKIDGPPNSHARARASAVSDDDHYLEARKLTGNRMSMKSSSISGSHS
jgi:hypothetical protein